MPTDVLGVSAFYHDSAACLVREGQIVAAAQEERFTRKKFDARFPANAIGYCLQEGRTSLSNIKYFVFYDKPLVKFERLLETYVAFSPKGVKSFLAAMNYAKAFADLQEIQLPACRDGVQHAWHLFVIQLNIERLKINRNQFIEALREKEIGTSVHFIPLHFHPYYRDTFGYKPEDFPNASAVFDRIISLPIYPKMTEGNVRDVIVAVRQIVQEYRR